MRIFRNRKPVLSIGYNDKIHCEHISLPPAKTCCGRPCRAGCYATANPVRLPSQQVGWNRNYESIMADPVGMAAIVADRINKQGANYFRFNVAGDIPAGEPGRKYMAFIQDVCSACPGTSFLLFSKTPEALSLRGVGNLQLVVSLWPGMIPAEIHPLMSYAAVWNRNDEAPDGWFECPGECYGCRVCWHHNDMRILFRAHGAQAARAEKQIDEAYKWTVRKAGE